MSSKECETSKTDKTCESNAEDVVKAAETVKSEPACAAEKKEAEKVLATTAEDARKAENFDHGKKAAK